MVEPENLRQASLYINNQLLSRGLLRDGERIDFTHPGDSSAEVAATMGRVMAVVNDLILRRDRDAEHRESLSTTLRTLRAESLRQANDIQRLQEKNAEYQRKVSLSESAESTMRTQLKSAEAIIQRLKEEAARTKVLVAQTRAACANEVRKRDRQIDGLKKAVTEAGRARGASKSPGITSITVAGNIGSDASQLPDVGPANEGYDLRAETNSFLAELAKGLSEENEAVLSLMRKTTKQLKEMSGWDAGEVSPEKDGNQALALPASCAEMSAEIESILEHLRTILTNPSFVPIEEVVVREDEIHRLRDGWEKMETRWKEAVHLIDGWRNRMQVSGRPVNVEELKMGLRLSPVRVQNVAETAQGFGLRLSAVPEAADERSMMHSPTPGADQHFVPPPELDDAEVSDSDSSIFEDDIDVDDLDVEEPNVEVLQQSFMLPSSPLPIPPQLSPLRDSNAAGNRGPVGKSTQRMHQPEFTTILEENTRDLKAEAPLAPPTEDKPQQSPKKKSAHPPRPVQQQDDAPPPTLADLSASASSTTSSVQLIKTPNESAPKTSATSATSARTRGRVSPTSRPQETSATRGRGRVSPVSRQEKSVTSAQPSQPPSRSNSTRDKSRPRPKTESVSTKTERLEKSEKSPAPAPASTSSKAAAPSANKSSTDIMPPPPLPNPEPTPSRDRSPRRGGNSRLPLPRSGGNILPPPQQSPLSMATIAAKLAASERDADAARVRAKLKAARMGSKKRVSLAPPTTNTDTSAAADASRSTRSDGGAPGEREGSQAVDEDEDELAPKPEEMPLPRKRERRTSRVASRRRSTLNPWELGALIQGNVPAVVGGDGEE
ncbi:Afadin and alpha-actinin-binding-domain-containing protein [Podospora aff. communis PSN243]|uniref:Afadin and alpha-actinin-binding-domain-containing protein n=1 Tax=Podospora aff. communis PSN243 TaxID=3040156 RepID=A0AAV9GVT7_9PEZI|nr:Afadin and alpha-actinin-binding-domain-containing protein [Podospora aff. communis PSN243]